MTDIKLTEQQLAVVLCALQQRADFCLEQYRVDHDMYWEEAYMETREVYWDIIQGRA